MASAGHASDTITLTRDSPVSTAFDAVLWTASMSGLTSLVKTFDPPLAFDKSDEIDVALVNTNQVLSGVAVAWQEAD